MGTVAEAVVTLVAETRRPPMASGVDMQVAMAAVVVVVAEVVAPTSMSMTSQLSPHWVRQYEVQSSHSKRQQGGKSSAVNSYIFMTGQVPQHDLGCLQVNASLYPTC